MHAEIYNRLLELARSEALATYSQIAPLAGLSMDNESDRDAISEILVEIARFEAAARRPMLTAVVVHYGQDNNPGEGFFAIAEQLGLYRGSRDQFVRLQFWVQQVKAVHAYWVAHP